MLYTVDDSIGAHEYFVESVIKSIAKFEIQLEIKHLADYSCTPYIGILQERCVCSYKCFLYLHRLIEQVQGLQV